MNSFRRARLIQGMTQAELANALGVSTVTICKWELGRGLPKAKRLKEVADALHTTVSDLLNEPERRSADGAAS